MSNLCGHTEIKEVCYTDAGGVKTTLLAHYTYATSTGTVPTALVRTVFTNAAGVPVVTTGGTVTIGACPLPPAQTLSLVGQTISLSGGGGSVTIPDLDTQDLSISGNVISLTNGGSVTLPTVAPQTLSISGQSLALSGGNSVTIPATTSLPASSITGFCPEVQSCLATATIPAANITAGALSAGVTLPAANITGLIPATNLPSYVDDVLEAASFAALPASGETGKIYTTLDTNKIYRWSGSAYIEIVTGGTPTGAAGGHLTGTYPNPTLTTAGVATTIAALTPAQIATFTIPVLANDGVTVLFRAFAA